MRFKTLFISQPSTVKQQREITKICVICDQKGNTVGKLSKFPIRTGRHSYTLYRHKDITP